MSKHGMAPLQGKIQHMLRAWAQIVVARRNLILWVTLGLVVAAGILTGTRLVIRNSTLDLIRKDSPVFKKYLAYMEEFDVRDEIVVVLKSDDLKASRAAANRLAEKLKTEQGLSRVYYRHDFSPMADRLLLLADEEQLTGIRRQMEELATLVKGNKQALNLNGILGEASSKFNDPYLRKSSNWQEFIPFIEEFVRNLKRLAKDLETPVQAGNGNQGLGELSEFEADLLKNEYLSLGEDGKTILMLLRPSVEEQKSPTPFTGVIDRVRKVVKETKPEFSSVTMGVTGEPVLLYDELKQSEQDMIFASIPYRIMHEFQIPVYEEMARRDAEFYEQLSSAGFMLDWGDDGSGLFMKYLRRGSGYYIDVGASQLIIDGKIKLKSGHGVSHLTETSVVLTDGTELPADAVVYATGYGSMNGWAAQLISQEVADKVGKCWGLGSSTTKDPGPWEGEQRNMWKPTQQEALWFHGGNLHQSRHYSQFLSLQLKARYEGIPTPVYGLAEVYHKG